MQIDMVSSDRLTRWICNDVTNISIPSRPTCFRIDAKEIDEYKRHPEDGHVWYRVNHETNGSFLHGYTNYRVIFQTNGDAKGFILTSEGDVTHMVQAVQVGLGLEMA